MGNDVLRVLGTLVIAVACAAVATPGRADLAVSCACSGNDDVRLYYVAGPTLYRATCRSDSILYNHDTCKTDPATAPAAQVIAALDAYYGRDPALLLTQRDQLVTKIALTEAKLDEFLARSTPDAPVEALQRQIRDKTAARAVFVPQIAQLQDQIARIQAELRTSPDADLAAQLEALAQSLAVRRQAQAVADGELALLRGQLVDAYAALGAVQDFQDLWHSFLTLASELDGTDSSLGEATADQALAQRHIHRVLDQTFTWETLRYSRSASKEAAFAGALESAFAP